VHLGGLVKLQNGLKGGFGSYQISEVCNLCKSIGMIGLLFYNFGKHCAVLAIFMCWIAFQLRCV